MKRAFTLIELLVVIAIIAVLAAIVAPNAFRAIEKAKVTATVADVRSIRTGAMAFYADTGTWPADCTASPCTALLTVPDMLDASKNNVVPVPGWDGPYVEKWPLRAKWGGVYLFRNGNNGTDTVGGFTWGASTAVSPVRVISISSVTCTASNVTADIAKTTAGKIDMEIDGAVGENAGSVRYTLASPATIVYILVSAD